MKCNFLTADRDFSTKISVFTVEGVFKVLENFIEIFDCFKNYSFYNILFSISKLCGRNGHYWTVICNVQFSTSLNSLSQSTF